MGVYAITGASSGIGAKTKELLLQKGHEVINIDLKDGDICANLATPEGRQTAVDKLHELHPEGLDGMICNAGVSGACGNAELIISLNYFGTVAIAKGVYDLLQKKHGSCVVTVSNTISQGAGRKDIVDLLNNIGDEKRVLSLVSSMDSTNLSVGNSLYVSTKYARKVDPQSIRYLGSQRCPHQCGSSRQRTYCHDRYHEHHREDGAERSPHSHQIWSGMSDGTGRDCGSNGIPGIQFCQRCQRQHHVRRRRYRCTVKF